MDASVDRRARARALLDDAVHQPGRSARHGLARVRSNAVLIVQCGLAAGLSWFVAGRLVHHHVPFFAPIAAVVVLGISTGARLRRTVELIIGVAVGILVGDLLVGLIGTGSVQLGLVVALAMAAALVLGGGSPLVTQAGSSAVLIATLYPPGSGMVYTRWLDALIGGLVGFGVHALLLPINPLTTVRNAARPVLTELAAELAAVGAALRTLDAGAAGAALDGLRATEPALQRFRTALDTAAETVAVAPVRWRVKGQLGLYADAATYVDHAVRNSRVLARRAAGALTAGESVPATLADAVDELAEGVRCLYRELERAKDPAEARDHAIEAIRAAALGYGGGVGFSTTVVVAQVQSTAYDLLRATGLDDVTVQRVVRRARKQPHPPTPRRS